MSIHPIPDDTILAWYILDPDTKAPCVQCSSRAQARELVKPEPGEEPWAIIAKLVKAH